MALTFEKKDNYKRQWNLTDFSSKSVVLSQIIDLSPAKDKPPAIDRPKFRPNDDVEFFEDNSPVILVTHNGVARAYPLSLLLFHQVVNDELDDLPLCITYCPLTNSSIVYERKLGNLVLDFGNTRKAYLSNSLIYDRETQSWWEQYTGLAIVGRYTDSVLNKYPSTIIPYSKFRSLYPDGLVLVPNRKSAHNYGYTPFAKYDSQDHAALYQFDYPYTDLHQLSYLVEIDGYAITLDYIKSHEHVAWGNTLITYKSGMPSVLDAKRVISGRDIGYVELTAVDDTKPHAISYNMPFAFAFKAFNPEKDIFYKDE